MAAIFAAVPDGDLSRMATRAYHAASRLWSEYRAEPNGSPIKPLLLTGADSAESWWRDLRDEQERREDMAGHPGDGLDAEPGVEVRSADQYAVSTTGVLREWPLPDGGVTSIELVGTKPLVPSSPWVHRALRHELPIRVTDSRVVR